MQAVLPLLLLLLLLAAFQSVDLHGLGGLGVPHISRAVGQSHGCKSDKLPSHGAWSLDRVSAHPFPMQFQHLEGLLGWGFSLQRADGNGGPARVRELPKVTEQGLTL